MNCLLDPTTVSTATQPKRLKPELHLNNDAHGHKRPDGLPKITFAILVPDHELLYLYLRPETGRLRFVGTILTPQQLLDQIRLIPLVSILVLAGNRLADRVAAIILPHRELYVVPDAWFGYINGRDATRRARTAARLVHAHLIEPINLRLPPIGDEVPF